MTAYTAWYDYVMPHAAGTGNLLASQAIRDAVIEFCRRTRLYSFSPAAVNVVGLTHTYTFAPDADTEITDFLDVFVSGDELHPATEDQLDATIKDWRTTAIGPAETYIVPEANKLRLVPTPSVSITGGLVVKAALRPLSTSISCPDFIFNEYREAIMDGALAALFSMPRKPWTNADLHRLHDGKFNSWCSAGGVRRAQARTRTRLRTKTYY